MNKSDFYYDLPEQLIAQTPVYPRDCSRMLVYDRISIFMMLLTIFKREMCLLSTTQKLSLQGYIATEKAKKK